MMLATISRTGGPAALPWQPAAETLSSSSDYSLIARIAGGDALAMRTLFARHHTPVYRWVRRMVRDEGLAEDLLSEVFLDVWRHAASFEGRSSVSTWLLAIARHKALSARRRRVDAELDEEIAAEICDPADDPEISLLKKDQAELLRQGIGNLPHKHREVLDLVYYHGKSVKEVAEITGAPEATIKTRMFHARRKLAELVPVIGEL
jgi:RNA polymerase sigma-70 factor, ECF subfamily